MRWKRSVGFLVALVAASGGMPVQPASAAATDQPVLYVGGGAGGAVDVTSFEGKIGAPDGTLAAFGSPSVVRLDGQTTGMWFCARSGANPAQIGYKTSVDDGRTWNGGTSYSLFPSEGSLDRLGVCNPSVVRFGQYFYMVYESEYPQGNPRLFVARASADAAAAEGWRRWRWEKWTGAGWQWNGAPAELKIPNPVAADPSLVVLDDRLYVFYRESVGSGVDHSLLVKTAPLIESWPSQLSSARQVLTYGRTVSGLDVKWDEAGKGFTALGVDGSGLPVGFRTDGATGQFRATLLDELDPQASSASDIAIHGDSRGNRGGFVTYEVPGGTGVVKLRRSALTDAWLPTGAFTDPLTSAANWITSSVGTTTSGWKSDSGALAFDPPVRARGEAVGKAWLGDGLYQLEMHGEHNSVGDSVIVRSGLQIGRQHVNGRYGTVATP